MFKCLFKDSFIEANKVEVFSGFPYLMTCIVRSMYHFIILPSSWSRIRLFTMAKLQSLQNRLDTFLILSPREFVLFPAYSQDQFVETPPACSVYISDKLRPLYEIPDEPELKNRKEKLSQVIEEVQSRGGYIFGDLSKGGRRATVAELQALKGFQKDRIPVGLAKCWRCGFYRGTCLDPSPVFSGLVMKVYCRCENDNRCARCGQPLYQFKLNANYFKEADSNIWHVPGFSGLNHVCPDLTKEKSAN